MFHKLPDSIRTTMQALVKGLQVILGRRLVGVYVGGSLTMGDFCEATSDLDFLVVTEDNLSQEDGLAIAQLHRELLRKYPDAARLEGDYVAQELLTPEGTTAPCPGCERGVFVPKVGEIMLSADNIYNMREQGVACYGPDPHLIFPAVSPSHVRMAVRQMLGEFSSVPQTPEEAACELLNLLRSACAIESGVPTTKSAGAEWAIHHLEVHWLPAVQAALAIRRGIGTNEDGEMLIKALPELEHVLKAQFC